MSDVHAVCNHKQHCLTAPKQVRSAQVQQLTERIGKLNLDANSEDILEVTTHRQPLNALIEFYDSIPEYEDMNHLSNKEFYKQLEDLRMKQRKFYDCLLNEAQDDELIQKSSSRRSVRIESPKIAGSPALRTISSTKKCGNSSPSDCTLTLSRSAPCSPRRQVVGWKDECKKPSSGEIFRAHPVPISSKIPLFNKIMYDQEKRRQVVKKRSKEALKARMRLFSFTKREEELADVSRRLSKSSPDLFTVCEKTPRFRAKPVPKNLFTNYAYRKMNEDQYYRSLQKKIRAEEMLKTASLPPSMAKREQQERNQIDDMTKSFREMYELGFLMGTSPSSHKSWKPPKLKKKKGKRSACNNSTKSSPSPSSFGDSVNRSNLAAVLRFETTRKRMEDEITRRLDEVKIRDEMRWREKVMRKRPVWQTLAYSQEEDRNMRLQMRRDEERLRHEEFRAQMQTMYGRVKQQPTLFERQSQNKFASTADELIAQLYATEEDKDEEKEESDGCPTMGGMR